MGSASDWVALLGSMIVTTTVTVVFIYSNFQTRREAETMEKILDSRLERIGDKLDQAIGRA